MERMANLVDRVTGATAGTRSDPLSREEVEQVVVATVEELRRGFKDYKELFDEN